MMKNLLLVVVLAACGSKQSPGVSNSGSGAGSDTVGAVKDTRTAIEKRRDTACETLGPKIKTIDSAALRAGHWT